MSENLQHHPEEFWLGLSAAEWSRKELYEAFDAHIDKDDVGIIVDIGANYGFSTRMFAMYFDPDVIYAFDPGQRQAEVFSQITEKVANKTPIVFERVGIYYGQREGRLLASPDGNRGGDSVEEAGAEHMGYTTREAVETIQLRTIEEMVPEHPAFVKIDVEGSEYNIIMNSQVLQTTKYLLIEWHDPDIDLYEFSTKHLPMHEIVWKDSRGSTLHVRKDL